MASNPTAQRYIKNGIEYQAKNLKRKFQAKSKAAPNKRVRKFAGKGTNENSLNTRDAKVKGQFKKSVSHGKKKRVKVSRNFRLKVNQALLPQKYKGFYLESGIIHEGFSNTLGQTQKVFRIGNAQDRAGCMFDPLRVLDAASVLFAGKVATENAKFPVVGGFYTPGDQSFDAHTAKITVENSYSSYVLKNNTNRTWIIDLYECAPRKQMDDLEYGDVMTQWERALANEHAAGVVLDSSAERVNIDSALVTTLYNIPQYCKTMMRSWKFEKHAIVLDPGQTYDHFVQGPSNVTYDFGKFWAIEQGSDSKTIYNLQPKFTRQIMCVARLDLVSSSSAHGRLGLDDNVSGTLIAEYKNYIRVQCPESTGGNVKVAALNTSTPMQLDYKRDSFCIKNWDTTTASPSIRFEEQTGTNNEDL